MLLRTLRRLAPSGGPSNSEMKFMVEDTVSKELAGKLRAHFYDAGQKKCTLCNEVYTCSSYPAHCCYAWHQARVGVVERMLAGHAVGAATAPARWWAHISKNAVCHFRRLPGLSHETQAGRLKRIFHLLVFLVQRGVIRESLTIFKNSIIQRTVEFEKFEMVGDNVIKYIFHDRLTLLFPQEEGGINPRLLMTQQLIDSNEGLLRCYDYLHLDWIIGCKLPNSKTKADVIESLFGELQTWLWADDVREGRETYDFLKSAEHRSVRVLVEHTLNELTHVLVMNALLSTHDRSIDFVLKNIRSAKGRFAGASDDAAGRPKYALRPFMDSRPLPQVAASGGSHQLVAKGPLGLQAAPRGVSALYREKFTPIARVVSDMAAYDRALQGALAGLQEVADGTARRVAIEKLVSGTYVGSVGWGMRLSQAAAGCAALPRPNDPQAATDVALAAAPQRQAVAAVPVGALLTDEYALSSSKAAA